MKVSRTSSGPLYVASTAVVMMEIIKIVSCLLLLRIEKSSTSRFLNSLYLEIYKEPLETMKMLVPAALYAVQNNLLYAALSNLDATTFQVTYQLKILTTALFSVAMLGKKLTLVKWFALILLMAGVAMVQMQSMSKGSSSSKSKTDGPNPVIGLIAVLLSCVSSGFAGVYFEKILKKSMTGLWIKNIQLGLFGLLFSLITMLLNDAGKVFENGFFFGYSPVTWSVVLNQALGGLVVAMVVKYADNILKGFATSVSIVVSAVISFYVFSFRPSFIFVVGAHLVIFAVYVYSLPDDDESSEKQK
jgi:solute carrier family 35 (UDP-sugar transporter), member A1/2/3